MKSVAQPGGGQGAWAPTKMTLQVDP